MNARKEMDFSDSELTTFGAGISTISSESSIGTISSIDSEIDSSLQFGIKEAVDAAKLRDTTGTLDEQAEEPEDKKRGADKTISYVFERVTKEDSSDVIPEYLNRYYLISQRCYRTCMLIFLLLIGFIGTTTEKAQLYVWKLFNSSLAGFVRLMIFVLGILMISWFVGFYIDDHRKKLLYFRSLTFVEDESVEIGEQKERRHSKKNDDDAPKER